MSVVEVNATGPLFDGQAHVIITRYCRFVEMSIAELGTNMVKEFLGKHFKYDPKPDNAGFYQSHIKTDRQIASVVVTDDQVIYGPWLEGSGTRNYPTTRFRGYAAFRTTSRALNGVAGQVAERELTLFLEELNGI